MSRKATPGELERSLPSWDDVRFFLAIHRAGSLAGAARPLEVTQPTCSRRLAALEASLRVRLFDRTPDGLQITAEGAALLESAEAMERNARELALRACTGESDLQGLVRVATNELFACTFVVGALVHLRARFPDIDVELVLSSEDTDLLRREADVAIRFRPEGVRPKSNDLVAQKLGDEPFQLYGADDYLSRRGEPADPLALEGQDVIAYAAPHPASAWCERAFADANVVLRVPSMQVVTEAVVAGLGLGVIPRRAARRRLGLRPLSPPVAHGTGWIVVHSAMRKVPRVRAVIDTLVALYRADALVG